MLKTVAWTTFQSAGDGRFRTPLSHYDRQSTFGQMAGDRGSAITPTLETFGTMPKAEVSSAWSGRGVIQRGGVRCAAWPAPRVRTGAACQSGGWHARAPS